jgi:hypothetical protein
MPKPPMERTAADCKSTNVAFGADRHQGVRTCADRQRFRCRSARHRAARRPTGALPAPLDYGNSHQTEFNTSQSRWTALKCRRPFRARRAAAFTPSSRLMDSASWKLTAQEIGVARGAGLALLVPAHGHGMRASSFARYPTPSSSTSGGHHWRAPASRLSVAKRTIAGYELRDTSIGSPVACVLGTHQGIRMEESHSSPL